MGYGGYLVKFGNYTIPNNLIKQGTFSSYYLADIKVESSKGAKGVKIEKNRQGMTMREAMEFDGDHMKFVEISKPFDDVVAEIKKKERGDGFKSYNGNCPF